MPLDEGIDIARALQLAVLSVDDDRKLWARHLPTWWTSDIGRLHDDWISVESLFLESFLADAEPIWSAAEDGVIVSQLFVSSSEDEPRQLQAIAIQQQQRNFLLLRSLDVLDEWLPHVLQTARSNLMQHSRDRSNLNKEVAEIKADRDEAKRLERIKSEFLANMSHEIRTPLTTIMGMASLAKSIDISDQQRMEHIDAIASAADRLHRLSNDILDLSRIQAERLELENQPFSLADMLRDFESDWLIHANDKQLEFSVNLLGDANHVIGDEYRLRQILSNLVGNALKFTEQGFVRVAVKANRSSPDDSRYKVHFAVQDSGVGISVAEQTRIFESFTQVDSSVRRLHQGAGLGLAIAANLVRLMTGTLVVKSEIGNGSCFSFTIELQRSDPPNSPKLATAAHSAPNNANNARADSNNTAKPLRVLVAEDHALNRSLIVEALESKGIETFEAENGKVAVEAWRAGKYDVVLMDVQMPVMSGIDAIGLIREAEQADNISGLPQNSRTPIVALTAHAMREEKQRLLDHGADRLLTKPFDPDELVRLVREVGQPNIPPA